MKFIEDNIKGYDKEPPKKDEWLEERSYVEWQEYNYPSFAPLIYYNKEKCVKDRKKFMTLLEISLYFSLLFYLVFIVAAIIDAAKNKRNHIVVFIAFFNMLFAFPLAFYTFYKGHQGLVLGKGYFTMYKICESLIISLGTLVFVFSVCGYHGPLFLIQEFQNPKKNHFFIILVLSEILLFFMGLILRLYCLMRVWDFYDTNEAALIN